MKKFFALMLALAMVLSLTACGSSSSSTDDAGNDAATSTPAESGTEADGDTSAPSGTDSERTQLIVGFDAAFPPYGYLDDASGDYIGFDLSLAQAVCDYYGWELVKQPIDWDSKDMELSSGAIDCIWNGFTMNGRVEEYTWSEPYIDNSQVIVVKADSGIATIDDLNGKNLDVQADSSALAAIQGEEPTEVGAKIASIVNLTQIPDYNTAFQDLEAGACDAIAMDVGVANYQLANRDGDFVILDEEISSEQYGIGFKLGNEELRDQVQTALNSLQADGSLQTILDDWSTIDDGAYSFLADTWCLGESEISD